MIRRGWVVGVVMVLVAGGAGGQELVPPVVTIAAGTAVVGSAQAERERAYALDQAAYGHDATRRNRWYENELPRQRRAHGAFAITRSPITNRQYAAFIAATGRAAPNVDETRWRESRLVHPYARTRRFAWRDGRIPAGRADHPVVLVTWDDARAYAAWLSKVTGRRWRLPTQLEWEVAARGRDGRAYPWGADFDPKRLNSADSGPFDTVPVGQFPAGPFGLIDAAGQVFEWTADDAGSGRVWVKGGGSWDDRGCGVCRPAARHTRPKTLKHILIGFRLVRE